MTEPTITVLYDSDQCTMPATEYVMGVLPAEMPASWPLDALRALAVAALSYALSKGGVVWADQRDQVYNPTKRTQRTDDVAKTMRGLVATYQGKPARLFYSAACGGHTTNTWAPGYLCSVGCPCNRSRNGHGQGLCQYGAKALAEAGLSWRGVLENYYHDIEIVENWGEPVVEGGSVLSFQTQRPSYDQWLVDEVARSQVDIIKVLDPDHGKRQPFGPDKGYIGRFTFSGNADAGMVYQGKAGASAWWGEVGPRLESANWVTHVEGSNEAAVRNEQEAVQFVAFELERQHILLEQGYTPLTGQFGTGCPPFSLFRILGEALCRPGVIYVRHSYGMRTLSPTDWSWEWHVMRHRKDWQALQEAGFPRPPTMLTEVGIDWGGNPTTDGWRAQGLSPAQYVAQLAGCDAEWRRDGILVATPFVWLDYNWPSFRMTQEVTRLMVDYMVSQSGTAVDPLPELETAIDARTLAQKCRWWYEEETRQREAGNTGRADAIHYSLTKLLYRLENAL